MNKICIFDYGCIRRSLDANKIKKFFLLNNYELTSNLKNANLIIFVSCGFKKEQSDFCIKKIQKLKRYNKKMIVTGCLPSIEPSKLNKIFNGPKITTKNLYEFDEIFPKFEKKFNEIKDSNFLFKRNNHGFIREILQIDSDNYLNYNYTKGKIVNLFYRIEKNIIKYILGGKSLGYNWIYSKKYFIRVSWGCNSNCTYCNINKAIGPLKSKPIKSCINEVKIGLEKGIKHFIITGDNTGSYGLDIGSNFSDLLNKITEIPEKFKIEIFDLNAGTIVNQNNELQNIIKKNKINHINIGLQSASNRILRLMNRYSNVKKIKKVILNIKKISPNIFISIYMMIGFPTENWKEFLDTLHFINETKIDGGIVNACSISETSRAIYIKPNINKKEINKRMKYCKKFLKKNGYNAFYLRKLNAIWFSKKYSIEDFD